MTAPDVRRLAWSALRDVEDGRPLDETLDGVLVHCPEDRDRRFLAELVKGVLRRRGRYDRVIDALSERGAPSAPVRNLLRLGLHQLLGCDGVPAHAALNETVELAGRVGQRRAAGYVNGLLRKVARRVAAEGRDVVAELFLDPQTDSAAYLAAWHSLPRWLVDKWIADHGAACAADLCAAADAPPPLWLHVLAPADPEAVAAGLAEAGFPMTRHDASPRALCPATAPSRAELRSLLAGRPELIVQDLHVQDACDHLLAGCGEPALDLCAAPGGKTFRLRAALGPEARVIAADLSAERLHRLHESMARAGRAADLVVAGDGHRAPFADAAFATVLLDGPCTGTGVLRRHPEGRWRLEPAAIAASAERLLGLAREATRLVRPGGRLLYATCSLEPEENEGVIQALLAAEPGLGYDALEPADAVRRWFPREGGGDGFFAVRLRRHGG